MTSSMSEGSVPRACGRLRTGWQRLVHCFHCEVQESEVACRGPANSPVGRGEGRSLSSKLVSIL